MFTILNVPTYEKYSSFEEKFPNWELFCIFEKFWEQFVIWELLGLFLS